MRIARVGEIGRERPVVLVGEDAIFVDSLITDWDRETLSNGGYQKVASANLSALPRVDNKSSRIGSPIAHPTKVICVGLNYLLHIKETNAATPPEPIIFMKAPDSVVGPNDPIVIPPGSLKTDYEVDAIAGATITGDGVSAMIKSDLKLYVPYFKSLKK